MSVPSLQEVSTSLSLISAAKQIFSLNQMSSVSLNGNEEVKSRLKFIGKIPTNVKISTEPLSLQQESMTAKLLRTWNCDSRSKTQSFLSETLSRSFEILDSLLQKSPESKYVQDLLRDLEASIQGISNLRVTYNTDLKFVCNLDVLIETVQNKIQEVYVHHPFLKPFSELKLITPSTSPDSDD